MKDFDIENQERATALEQNIMRTIRIVRMVETVTNNMLFDLTAHPYQLGATTRILTARHIAANNLTPICLN